MPHPLGSGAAALLKRNCLCFLSSMLIVDTKATRIFPLSRRISHGRNQYSQNRIHQCLNGNQYALWPSDFLKGAVSSPCQVRRLGFPALFGQAATRAESGVGV
jgi:hypothetical protein